jgi:hypothetical protein
MLRLQNAYLTGGHSYSIAQRPSLNRITVSDRALIGAGAQCRRSTHLPGLALTFHLLARTVAVNSCNCPVRVSFQSGWKAPGWWPGPDCRSSCPARFITQLQAVAAAQHAVAGR